jgi:hypothetical protein
MFLKWRGFNIDSGLSSIQFNPPQNFASYRQAELDTSRIGSFTSLEQIPYMSKRFLLQRFLGLTEEEIKENEELWKEERDNPEISPTGSDLRSVGISPAGIEADTQTGEEIGQMEPTAGIGTPEVTPGLAGPTAAGGAMPAAGAAPPTA